MKTLGLLRAAPGPKQLSSTVLLVGILFLLGGVRSALAEVVLEELHSFVSPPATPLTIVASPDGNVYGTCIFGGSNGLARLFQITPDGTVSTAVSFTNELEVYPTSIVAASDGTLYGSATYGGTWQWRGASNAIEIATNSQFELFTGKDGNVYGGDAWGVYRFDPSGTNSVVHTFYTGTNSEGHLWTQDALGNFYDFSNYDGTNYQPFLFKTAPDGTLTRLYTFDWNFDPRRSLVGGDGNLYITGLLFGNTAFLKMTPDGEATVLRTNMEEIVDWVEADNGNIYGVTRSAREATIFELKRDGSLRTVVSVEDCWSKTNAFNSWVETGVKLCQGSNGHLYCAYLAENNGPEATILELTTNGVAVRSISLGKDNFFYLGSTVTSPNATLQLASNGSLYGTTESATVGFGGLFRITPSGVVTNVSSLSGENRMPLTSPVEGSDGKFYGAGGTLVQMVPNGPVTNYDFIPQPYTPWIIRLITLYSSSALAKGADGNLYGACTPYGSLDHGIVFRVLPGKGLKNIYTFTNDYAGAKSLVEDGHGTLYGISSTGQYHSFLSTNWGSIFRLTTSGVYTELVGIDRETSPLVRGNDGCFYAVQHSTWQRILLPPPPPPLSPGFTSLSSQIITIPDRVIKIDTNGATSLVAEFTSATGTLPKGPLMLATDGNFYGVTGLGGAANNGTIYRLTPGGTLDAVVDFAADVSWSSSAGLTQGADGKLYGVASQGGIAQQGSVYRVDLGLPAVTTNVISTVPVGLFSGTIRHQSHGREVVVGYFSFRVSENRAVKGSVYLPSTNLTYPFKGTFDDTFQQSFTTSFGKLQLWLSLAKQANTTTVTGSITRGTWNATLKGKKVR